MIKIVESYRGKEKVFTANNISVDGEGNIILSKGYWFDGRYIERKVVITPVSVRDLRDACNKSLGKITGHEYTTMVKVK